MSRRRYLSAAQRRKRRGDIMGAALIAASLAALIAFAFAAYKIDAAHGISVSQSLHNAGL